MSKTHWSFQLLLLAGWLIAVVQGDLNAQELTANIRFWGGDASISGRFNSTKSQGDRLCLSLLKFGPGAGGVERLVSDVELLDDQGRFVPTRPSVGCRHTTDRDFLTWKYRVSLLPAFSKPGNPRISWLGARDGLLILDALLPQPTRGRRAIVTLEHREGSSAFSTASTTTPGVFDFADVEKGVIVIGTEWRERDVRMTDADSKLLMSGEWPFNEKDVARIIDEIYRHYRHVLLARPGKNFQIALMKYPIDVPAGNWDADTRGSSITILSSDTPFQSQSLQRLHEQLRHEMFHLWIPNGVNLTGNYDWFYEGFALYQSLRLGVEVNRIRFEDYLDTLSRAYDIDRRSKPRLSLVDASKNRWSGENNTTVYARGMLVAFLCDLAMLDASGGKRSTDSIVREIYTRHRPPAADQDAGKAVIEILRSNGVLIPIVDRYVTGTNEIEWTEHLRIAGIEAAVIHGSTRLTVSQKPNGRQKNLLDKLGYNNWRKLSKGNK